MCSCRGSHLLDRSLLKKRNKRISSRYVNVNLRGEKERERQTGSNGQVSTDLAITDSDRNRASATVSGLVFLIEVRLGFRCSEMESSCGLGCADGCLCIMGCLCDAAVCLCVRETTFPPFQTVNPRRGTIQQADRFIRREPDGCRAAAGDGPAEIIVCAL